ncbi:MAG: glycosyltransferase [Candidatus Omnitrophota bacterium]
MRRKIKIGFVNYSLNVGGIETLILEICKRLNRSVFEPCIFVFEKDGKLKDEYLRSGIGVIEVSKKERFDILLPFRLSKILREENISIVHTHNPTNWLYGGIAARLAGLPLIHTEHTTTDYDSYHVKRWEFIEWALAKFTRRITAVAGSVKTHMIKRSGINSKKIEVVYNAIETERFDTGANKEKMRGELSIRQDEFVIGNIARFYENKDHQTLLRAFKLVLEKIPNVYLLLIGDGPLKYKIESFAGELKIPARIKFLGNRRDIPQLLKMMDLFVLSSKREGLPIVLLEAMASGLPIVATDVDGNGELVLHEETGFVVPPADPKELSAAILNLLTDRSKAKRMAARGKERVKNHFTFNSMVEKYEKIYEEVCSNT